jgi:hypothetical protein
VPSAAGDIVEAYGIVTSNGAFHTYVVCSATGDNWRCHGLLYQPVPPPLCGGQGSAALARCIEGGDEAGIFYLRTGVCHQIANRILAAAGIQIPLGSDPQVAAAWLAYGTYGRNRRWVPQKSQWPDRWNTCNSSVPGASSGSAGSNSSQASNRIGDPMTRAAPVSPDPRSELSSLIQSQLGQPIDNRKLSDLMVMREHLQEQIDALSDQLMEREITPKAYLEGLDEALIRASKVGTDILGYTNFRKVFGELRANRLGDAKVFLEQYSKGH